MNIEEGWRFSTADFSLIACGKKKPGYVMLIRAPEEKIKWHLMNEELKEDADGPPLYVIGNGMTFEDAIHNANVAAVHAKPIAS